MEFIAPHFITDQIRHHKLKVFKTTGNSAEQHKLKIIKKQKQHNQIVEILELSMLSKPLVWPFARLCLATFFEDVEELNNQLRDERKSTKVGKAWSIVDRFYLILGPPFRITTDRLEGSTTLEKIHDVAMTRVARCYQCCN